jgi:hypothetical protein
MNRQAGTVLVRNAWVGRRNPGRVSFLQFISPYGLGYAEIAKNNSRYNWFLPKKHKEFMLSFCLLGGKKGKKRRGLRYELN